MIIFWPPNNSAQESYISIFPLVIQLISYQVLALLFHIICLEIIVITVFSGLHAVLNSFPYILLPFRRGSWFLARNWPSWNPLCSVWNLHFTFVHHFHLLSCKKNIILIFKLNDDYHNCSLLDFQVDSSLYCCHHLHICCVCKILSYFSPTINELNVSICLSKVRISYYQNLIFWEMKKKIFAGYHWAYFWLSLCTQLCLFHTGFGFMVALQTMLSK